MKRALTGLAALAFSTLAVGQNAVKIGVVAFISGPAAAPFGVPAKQAAELEEHEQTERVGHGSCWSFNG